MKLIDLRARASPNTYNSTTFADHILAHLASSQLVPTVGVFWETRTLYSHDAKALPSGRQHHDPTLQAVDHPSAQLLQASHLSGDVVGFNVYVNPTLVVHALDLHDRLAGRRLQHSVIAASARVLEIDRATKCIAPETGGLVRIGCIAVDQ
jgi:hypothetical protein